MYGRLKKKKKGRSWMKGNTTETGDFSHITELAFEK